MNSWLCKVILIPSLSFIAWSSSAQARDIRVIGDSVFALSGEITRELVRLSELPILSHARNGAKMAGIRQQYLNIRDEPITTMVMDGGGNDVLLGANQDCRSVNDRCKEVIENAVEILEELLVEMHEDGVQHVVLLGYYYPTGWQKALGKAVDYANPYIFQACESAEIHCVVVDPRERFAGRYGLITWDGIHPTDKGSRELAGMLWHAFIEHGIEQD